MLHGRSQQAIELTGRDSLPGLLVQHLAMIQQGLDVFARQPGDKSNRGIPHGAEHIMQIRHPFVGRHFAHHMIPFVDHEYTRLVLFGHIFAQLLVYFADALGTVEE